MPTWSRSPNGSELFYQTPDNRMMVASYNAGGDSFVADKPRLWSGKRFPGNSITRGFDLAPDGKRFAVLMAPDETGDQEAPGHVTFLLNFFDELNRKVPASQ